jgi:hypothetical protein
VTFENVEHKGEWPSRREEAQLAARRRHERESREAHQREVESREAHQREIEQQAAKEREQASTCTNGTYINSSGNTVCEFPLFARFLAQPSSR